MFRFFLLFVFFIFSFTPLSAFYLDFIAAQGFSSSVRSSSKAYEMLQLSLGESFFNQILHVDTSLQFYIDDRFEGLDAGAIFYFKINYGGIRVTWEGLNIELGYYQPKDVVDSPYASFINSAYIIDTLMYPNTKPAINLGYESKYLFFQMNWMGLGWHEYGRKFHSSDPNSDDPYNRYEMLTGDSRLTRGYNYKVFGGKVGNFRFGYQDMILYTGRYFDWAYATIPIPSIVVEYTRNHINEPGGQKVNDDYAGGFFINYKDEKHYDIFAQILFNDVSVDTLAGGKGSENPFKFAWNLGGWFNSGRYGRIGFFHGGALKYTFQTTASLNKSFTYNTFNYFNDGRFLPAENTWTAYKNGENNIAFMIAYQNNFLKEKLKYRGAAELVITGSQSPLAAWTEYDTWHGDGEGTRLLNGRLETKVIFYNSLYYEILSWLEIGFDSKIGFAHNALELYFPQPDEKEDLYPYLTPGNKTKLIFDLRLSLRFFFDWDFTQKAEKAKKEKKAD